MPKKDMPMKLHATLEAIYSERDLYGNCYWAMRYTDHETGRVVCGTISGGESNIAAVRRQERGQWDDGIAFRTVAMKKREFKRLTADWCYAGCAPADLYAYIKGFLADPG
jgi:hypothetical protein